MTPISLTPSTFQVKLFVPLVSADDFSFFPHEHTSHIIEVTSTPLTEGPLTGPLRERTQCFQTPHLAWLTYDSFDAF